MRKLLLSSLSPSSPFSPLDLFSSVSNNLASVSHAPQRFFIFQMSLLNNALATSRRMRHQNRLQVSQVEPCFFCGLGQDSIVHIFSHCPFSARLGALFLMASVSPFPPSLPFPPPLLPLPSLWQQQRVVLVWWVVVMRVGRNCGVW